MFKNPGRKIKLFAIALFIAGCFYSLIFSISLSTDPNLIKNASFHPVLFALVLFFGVFISYIIALFLYSWGELVENTANKNEE